MSTLIVFSPNEPERSIELKPARLFIGRHRRNTIVLPDPTVSMVHALLQHSEPGWWWVEDLSSTNGIWLNGRRVQISLLLPGDTLELGHCALRLLATQPLKKNRASVVKNSRGWISEAMTIPADFESTNLKIYP